MAKVLVVDDDETICGAFRQFLLEENHQPLLASNAFDALEQIRESRPDLVFMDVRLPGTNGLEALEAIRRDHPDLHVIIMTAYGTSQTSIDAARLGAYEYLMKPLDLDVLKSVLDKALESLALTRAAGTTREPEPEPTTAPVKLVGTSPAMQAAYRLIGSLSTNDIPVLAVGEPGVGKELVARTIHLNSERKRAPFLSVLCTQQEDRLKEELFGRSRTGGPSATAQTGKLAKVEGGTLYLRNVDALPLPIQQRLLRFLTDNTFERIDDDEECTSDCRVMAATSEDLAALVEDGKFSYELYEQLCVIQIHIPPLRKRREDLKELIGLFLERHSAEAHKHIQGIHQEVLDLFSEYAWPGNAAELEKVIRRACILARGPVITRDDLGGSLEEITPSIPERTETRLQLAAQRALQQKLKGPGDESPFHAIVADVEKVLVQEALAATQGNQVKAAELLGVNRTTLRKKIELFGL